MVRDKIFQMDNGKSYYVLEEVEYNGRKFLLSVECDVEKDELVNENDYHVMEMAFENGDLMIKQVEDDNLAKTVSVMLINKVRENNN